MNKFAPASKAKIYRVSKDSIQEITWAFGKPAGLLNELRAAAD